MSNNIIYLRDYFPQLIEQKVINRIIKPIKEKKPNLKIGDIIHLYKNSGRVLVKVKSTQIAELYSLEIRLSGLRLDGKELTIAEREEFVKTVGFFGPERYFEFIQYYKELHQFPLRSMVIGWKGCD